MNAAPVRWQAGTRVRETGSVLPMLVTRPVRYGDMLAEVRYSGATRLRDSCIRRFLTSGRSGITRGARIIGSL